MLRLTRTGMTAHTTCGPSLSGSPGLMEGKTRTGTVAHPYCGPSFRRILGSNHGKTRTEATHFSTCGPSFRTDPGSEQEKTRTEHLLNRHFGPSFPKSWSRNQSKLGPERLLTPPAVLVVLRYLRRVRPFHLFSLIWSEIPTLFGLIFRPFWKFRGVWSNGRPETNRKWLELLD